MAESLASFGYNIPTSCFCSSLVEFLQNLLLDCPLAIDILAWIQPLMKKVSPLFSSLLVRHVQFGFSEDELRVVPCFVFFFLSD